MMLGKNTQKSYILQKREAQKAKFSLYTSYPELHVCIWLLYLAV